MALEDREYELILFGATGYTGKLTAEHITTHCPTDLKWAVAGRSSQKLSTVVNEIKSLNPDRRQPGVEVAQLNKEDLNALARKTRVLITTVGPYHLYGTQVVEACAENGTHYLDVTGETPWVVEMVRKYHDVAKANGAIIIPQIGLESAPADMLAWSIVRLIREKLSVGTREVVHSIEDMKSGLPSGGTLATALGMLDHYSLKAVNDSMNPYVMCPRPPPKPQYSPGLFTKFFGVRTVPDLGTLTTSLQGGPDATIVYRSWGLLGPDLYGPHFQFSPYTRARNAFIGFLIHVGLIAAFLIIAIPPVRWLLRLIARAPGQGPPKEVAARNYVEYRAIGTADQSTSNPARAFAMLRWDGGLYEFTAVLVAQGAMALLRSDTEAKKLGGGLLTPATLGQAYVDRLADAGVKIETKLLFH